jgi:beta-glucosidase
MEMKTTFILFFAIFILASCHQKQATQLNKHDEKIDSLIAVMTIYEKVGQLNVINFGGNLINPQGEEIDIDAAIQEGLIGGLQNIRGVDLLTKLQKLAVEESRLGIPLMFPADIIHGTEVIFPIPLAFASSWDLKGIEEISKISAKEATALGINLTYSPMADIARDPRWGRVMEGAGEDTYLTSAITSAVVKGYQGNDLSDPSTFGACVKHFAAYGAVEAGRDYNIVDMSWRRLRDVYLPSYKAAFDAGCASTMVSFNDINGVPSSSNTYLLRDILRNEWGFEGFVIGDYTSVGELVNHGVAKDLKHAGELAINAGLDIDMASMAILKHVPELIEEGKVMMETLDAAVKNVLRVKYALGIMDNPYLYLDKKREKEEVFKPEYLQAARSMAQKSMVLLKNKNQLLPLNKNIKKLALIGPFVDDNNTPMGGWAFGGSHYESIVSLLDGIKNKVSDNTKIIYAKGCDANNEEADQIPQAVQAAKSANIVVVALGEPLDMIGEARSRTSLNIPGKQMELLKALHKTGKPIVVLLFSGRPLLLDWIDENIPSIVQVWHLGHESGNAIADVVFGDYNPSGKLTMSFPHSVGQIPIYYNSFRTGRPYQENYRWSTHYMDSPNTPLYAFGYGLSYTKFEYSNIELSDSVLNKKGKIKAIIKVKNTGEYDGTEIVQLYIQDLVGSITRPVKELKGFELVELKKGEEKEVRFTIDIEDLKFYNNELDFIAEPGGFKVFIGTSSDNVKEAKFALD